MSTKARQTADRAKIAARHNPPRPSASPQPTQCHTCHIRATQATQSDTAHDGADGADGARHNQPRFPPALLLLLSLLSLWCSGSGSGNRSCLSIYRSIDRSIYLYYLSICKFENEATVRLPQFLNLTASEAQQFCETSSILET